MLKGELCLEKFSREVDEAVQDVKMEKEARLEFMNLEMEILDREYLARREGRVEGIAEGQAKEKESTAMNLLKMNMTLEQIYQVTKLPIDRILEIAQKIKN